MSQTTPSMFVATQRLASFKPSKRRSSATNSRIPPKLKWPHPELTPQSLSDAGFFFAPSEDSPDNVTCYLCGKSLDGWEPGDDPLAEHLRHSKDCGWAMTATVMAQEGDFLFEPHGKAMIDARFKTYGPEMWPHAENLNLSIPKMVEAGFHFGPTKDSPDNAFCPYCQVSLAAWDPDDDPWLEHKNRAADCPFIVAKPLKPKIKRSTRALSKVKPALSKKGTQKKLDKEATNKTNENLTLISSSSEVHCVANEGLTIQDGTLQESEKMPISRRRRKRTNSVLQHNLDDVGLSLKRRQTRSSMTPDSEPGQRSTSNTRPELDAITALYPGKQHGKTNSNGPLATSTRSRLCFSNDSDIDQRPSLGLDQSLSDEGCAESAYQPPFIRQTKRTTRSRASMLMEIQSKSPKNARLCSNDNKSKPLLIEGHTSSSSKSSMSSYLKDQDEGLSLPIKVPKHLGGHIRIKEDIENMPTEVLSESPPTKKSRARTKKIPTNELAKETKPKRGRPPKRKGRTQSNNHIEEFPEANTLHNVISSVEKRHYGCDVGHEFISDTESIICHDTERRSASNSPYIHNQQEKPTSLQLEISHDELDFKQTGDMKTDGHAKLNPTSNNFRLSSAVEDSTGGQDNEAMRSTTDQHQTVSGSACEKRIVSFATTGNWEYKISDRNPSQLNIPTDTKPVDIPLVSTPSTKGKSSLFTKTPWVPIEFNQILESTRQSLIHDEVILSTSERDMTVEEWVAWNAVNAEKRLNDAAEKIVLKFEEQGKLGIAAIEGTCTN